MKNLLSFIAFILIFILCFIGAWHLLGIRKEVPVQDISEVPFMQAVLLTKEGPKLLMGQEEIEGFLAKHPDATFLIPPQDRKLIQERINESLGADRDISLQVKSLAEGKQQIEVFLHGDPSDYVLGYEATEKKITPKYYIRFSVFDLILGGTVSIPIAVLVYEASRRYIRRTLNKASAKQ